MSPDLSDNGAVDRSRRVADVLERLRSGVRQQLAELAAGAPPREEVRLRLAPLRDSEVVHAPPFASPHPLGRLVVSARRLLFRYFLNWYLHPILERQNRYNRISSRLIQDLVESNDRLQRQSDHLLRQVERLQQRLQGIEERCGS